MSIHRSSLRTRFLFLSLSAHNIIIFYFFRHSCAVIVVIVLFIAITIVFIIAVIIGCLDYRYDLSSSSHMIRAITLCWCCYFYIYFHICLVLFVCFLVCNTVSVILLCVASTYVQKVWRFWATLVIIDHIQQRLAITVIKLQSQIILWINWLTHCWWGKHVHTKQVHWF